MKKLLYLLSVGLVLSSLALVGCGDDGGDGPTIQEQQLTAIVGTWSTKDGDGGVTQNDADAPGDWASTTFTFAAGQNNAGSYTISGQPTDDITVFNDGGGNFTIAGTTAENFQLVFSGGGTVDVKVNSATEIELSTTIEQDQVIGGRTQSINGPWKFVLTK
ncbi:hypothetical protein FNH22_19475 [Fulvivirga sp. M361]|uniref:hypothetical protein n=1 Tax=Fulvivirga sp. M361 TaxID=2594266 RepID=UPI00117ADA70|nr:hypothetical protein [Fulvivirga sp. M361]TRX54299.1 hypothetical protein FNH22_19475 [Fulvivirga sp. M361]